MAYVPTPQDTSCIQLTPELQVLGEFLAENVHDVWAAQRLSQGWTYGPRRDDAAKRTPCLVPYEDLSETEKEYDRSTATETLKTILSMGYVVLAPDEQTQKQSANTSASFRM